MPERHRHAGIELAGQIADGVIREDLPSEASRGGAPARARHQWIGPEMVGDDLDWRIVNLPLGPGLYGGTSGIAMALAAAGSCAGDDYLLSMAAAVSAESLVAGADLLASGALDLASGSSGIAHAASWVGHLTGDQDLRHDARELARASAIRMVELPGNPDYLGGSAGAIVALTATCPDDAEVRRHCRTAARRLAEQARPALLGRSWPETGQPGSSQPDSPGLLGLAHGASGTALALVAAAADADAVDESRADLASVVQAAWDYERSWFDAATSNWPDLRPLLPSSPGEDVPEASAAPRRSMVAWCHGALGIGCARLAWLSWSPEPRLRLPILAEITAAIEAGRRRAIAARAALREGIATDVSLCHGLGGVTELLLAAADLPGGAGHIRAAARVGDLILAQREQSGKWPCGLPGRSAGIGSPAALEPPGLFLGLAGISLGLLRLDARLDLPSMAVPRSIPTQDG